MRAGSVAIKKYRELNGEDNNGLFLIIYDEYFDNSINHSGNVVGLKVTSTHRPGHYDVPILKKFNSFIGHDSFVMCSKPHVLVNEHLIVVGEIRGEDLLLVYKNFERFAFNVGRQVYHSLERDEEYEK